MEKGYTNRGFAIYEFKDANGVQCSLQKSSSAMEDKIWIGANEIGLKIFRAGQGWENVALENTIKSHYIANNRMHLTREQVIELLPILEKFALTGEI